MSADGQYRQDVSYQPYGAPTSTGVQPDSALYSHDQWNGGDALAAFGVSQLGARIFDPVVGRFLSRDPQRIPRTVATSNPYAFAATGFGGPMGKHTAGGVSRNQLALTIIDYAILGTTRPAADGSGTTPMTPSIALGHEILGHGLQRQHPFSSTKENGTEREARDYENNFLRLPFGIKAR